MPGTDDPLFVKRRRQQLGISWRWAAATAGLSPRTWAEVELCDGARGSDDDLAKVEAVLGMSPGVLKALNYEQTDPELIEIRREMRGMIGQLTTPEQLGEPVLDEIRGSLEALRARLRELDPGPSARPSAGSCRTP